MSSMAYDVWQSQILQVVFAADSGTPDVELHVPDDRGHMSDNGGGQHGRELRVDGSGNPCGVHHSEDQNPAMVDLGLLEFALGVCRESCQRE